MTATADYAAIISGRSDESAEETERLIVLAASADGTYRLLSLSGEFCGVGTNGKFYELSIAASLLLVRGVWVAEGERYSGTTMKFRFNQHINDLQLIGEEEESREDDRSFKVSTNYLARTILYSREAGSRRKEVKERLVKAPLFKLNEFICFSQDAQKPKVYISENFKVKRD